MVDFHLITKSTILRVGVLVFFFFFVSKIGHHPGLEQDCIAIGVAPNFLGSFFILREGFVIL